MTGPDLSEFEAQVRRKGGPCVFARKTAELTPEQQEKLKAALASPGIPHTAIQRVLDSWECRLDYNAVTKHRRQECSCAR